MKKSTLLLALITFKVTIGLSQPNPGFENWYPEFGYESPQGWQTFNFLSFVTTPPSALTAFKATGINVHSGNYALKLKSEEVIQPDLKAVFGDTAGGIFTGNLTLSPLAVRYGVPFTSRPEKLTFWAKYQPVGSDVGGGITILTKWDSVNNHRDTVAFGISIITPSTNYVFFEMILSYYSEDIPDSLGIAFTTSQYKETARLNSTLYIDDLAFLGYVSTNNYEQQEKQVKLYPSPANEYIIIQTLGIKEAKSVTIMDVSGKQVSQSLLDNGNACINTKNFTPGTYLYGLKDDKNQTIRTGRFNVINNHH